MVVCFVNVSGAPSCVTSVAGSVKHFAGCSQLESVGVLLANLAREVA